MNTPDQKFMRLAIKKAKEGIQKGQTPFGACIVKNKKVIACAHNAVWKNTDITAHAEIQAVRLACKKLKTIDLSKCTIYSTCEPCPMCFAACHWAKISTIVFAAHISDAKHFGFNELMLSNQSIKKQAKSTVRIISGFLHDESIQLFQAWDIQEKKRTY